MKKKNIEGLHLQHHDGNPMTNFLRENEGLTIDIDKAQMNGVKDITKVHEKLCKNCK